MLESSIQVCLKRLRLKSSVSDETTPCIYIGEVCLISSVTLVCLIKGVTLRLCFTGVYHQIRLIETSRKGRKTQVLKKIKQVVSWDLFSEHRRKVENPLSGVCQVLGKSSYLEVFEHGDVLHVLVVGVVCDVSVRSTGLSVQEHIDDAGRLIWNRAKSESDLAAQSVKELTTETSEPRRE